MGRIARLLIVGAAAAGTAAAVYALHRYTKSKHLEKSTSDVLAEIEAKYGTSTETLLKIVEDMRQEMVAGLEGVEGSRLKMLPTYVDNMPTGSEKGAFYALDLGGTNFRVMRVQLLGSEGRIGKIDFEGGNITPELMSGTKEALFDMMASKFAAFVAKESPDFRPPDGHHRELGFTFSFPCDQTAINSGKLIRWTKGFSIPDTEGHDVVKILEEAFQRQGLDMKVTALVNDAVGTLAGARYNDPDVTVAVILGTGSNACYEEREQTSWRLVGPPPASGHMVINIEWGNFNSGNLPVTEQDKFVDVNSPNPGEQQLEKLVSGMYLGEIARLNLLELHNKTGIFGPSCGKLAERLTLSTPNLSKIHADSSAALSVVGKILMDSFQISNSTYLARKCTKDIARVVCERGARLAAAAIVGVLKKIGRENMAQRTVVAVDGGLYENFTEYRTTLVSTLHELLGPGAKENLHLVLSKDGSGVGAALLAASHSVYS